MNDFGPYYRDSSPQETWEDERDEESWGRFKERLRSIEHQNQQKRDEEAWQKFKENFESVEKELSEEEREERNRKQRERRRERRDHPLLQPLVRRHETEDEDV